MIGESVKKIETVTGLTGGKFQARALNLALGLTLSLNMTLCSAAVLADDAATANSAGNLQGGVTATEAGAESILAELEQTVHHLEQAAGGAYGEAQRQDTIYAGGPEVLGPIIINPIGFLPTGGFLPVRKKWMDYFSMHVSYLAPILKQELDSFVMPPGVSSDTMNEYAEYKVIAARLPDLCDKMLEACKGPKYDNMTVAMASGTLHEELKRYEKVRKEIARDIKDDFKRADRAEKKEEKKAGQ